ncbi:MAG: Lcl domain-containing protein [Helicobacteraceae bacterium]
MKKFQFLVALGLLLNACGGGGAMSSTNEKQAKQDKQQEQKDEQKQENKKDQDNKQEQTTPNTKVFSTNQKTLFTITTDGKFSETKDKEKALKLDGYYQSGLQRKPLEKQANGDIYDPNTKLTWKDEVIEHQFARFVEKSDVLKAEVCTSKFGESWRLPTLVEALSLMDFDKGYIYDFKDQIDGDYWTQTCDVSLEGQGDLRGQYCKQLWTYDPKKSWITGKDPSVTQVYARCVKGDVWDFKNTLTRDDAKDVVLDKDLGLMWQDDASMADNKKQKDKDGLTYQAAVDYCEDLELGGHKDWRLPNIMELASIVEFNQKENLRSNAPEALKKGFKNLKKLKEDKQAPYASSTINKNDKLVWVFRLDTSIDPMLYYEPKDKAWQARCVRTMTK